MGRRRSPRRRKRTAAPLARRRLASPDLLAGAEGCTVASTDTATSTTAPSTTAPSASPRSPQPTQWSWPRRSPKSEPTTTTTTTSVILGQDRTVFLFFLKTESEIETQYSPQFNFI